MLRVDCADGSALPEEEIQLATLFYITNDPLGKQFRLAFCLFFILLPFLSLPNSLRVFPDRVSSLAFFTVSNYIAEHSLCCL
jgi:hypothetical protein